jgi:hypothetical protein
LSEETRLLASPPRIQAVRVCPKSGVRATLSRAPYPAERIWAHRIGLVSTEDFAKDLIRHVEAETRRCGGITAKDTKAMAARWERMRLRSAARMMAVAFALDLLIGGVVLFCSGQL